MYSSHTDLSYSVRSGLLVSSHAITTANVARALLFAAWASVLERARAARDSARSSRAATGGGKNSVSSLKKSASAAPGGSKQRSKKSAKKASPSGSAAPPRLLTRGDTAIVTPPASPPAVARPSAQTAETHRPAAAAAAVATMPSVESVPPAEEAAVVSSDSKPKPAKAVGTSNSPAVSNGAAVAGRKVVPAVPAAARPVAAEKTTGVPFIDVMTAEQVQAMVKEDERAWEQARLSDKLHSNVDANATSSAAVAVDASTVAKQRAVAAGVDDGAGAGWSEVGGSGSRGRAGSGGGGARGRVLSIRNVRAAAQAARTSSPGSDPATTTSASSSDSSEGCKEKSSRGGGRMTGRLGGGRAVQGAAKSSAAPRAGSKSTWATASDPSRGGGAAARAQPGSRGPTQTRVAPPARESEQATSRPSRASHAPWATARNGGAAAQVLRGTGKTGGGLRSGAIVAEPSPVLRGPSQTERRPVAATVDRNHASSSSSSLRQSLQPEVSAIGGSKTAVDGDKGKEEGPAAAASAPPAPPAWTNTPSHPLGMQPEPAALPPASEPPRPPPQHQQHWQRQQQREQQRQEQHQHQQHFFHQQEPRMMPMPTVPMQQHQDVGSHHYPPLSLPPQPHQHRHHHHHHQPPPPPPQAQQQQQHEAAMPQFIPSSDESFPPSSAHMPIPSANAAPTNAPAMIYPAHPAHIATIPSPGVSPGGEHVVAGDPHFHVHDGSYDSPGSAGGAGFSPDTGSVLPHPQAMVLPAAFEQQQQQQQQQHVGGRFSPPTLQVVPIEEVDGGAGSDGGEAFEALMGALCWQVEYYFSADNLVTDSYLRGLMDPDGFVAVSKVRASGLLQGVGSGRRRGVEGF